MSQKRRPEISLQNVLFCMLVIFIHIISYAVSSYAPDTASYTIVMIPWRLASFVVPGFIMLAGVKLFLTKNHTISYFEYLRKRFFSVLVPYIISFIVYYILFVIAYQYTFNAGFILKHLFLGSLVYHFYFIVVIVQFDLLFPLWKKIIGKCSPIITVPFALLVTILFEVYFPDFCANVLKINFTYNDRIFTTYLSYWLIGCYIGKYYESFTRMLKKNFISILVMHIISTVSVVYFSYLAYKGIAYIPYMNFIHYMYVLSSLIFIYALSGKLPAEKIMKVSLIKKTDEASFYIYLYHVLAILLTNIFIDFCGIAAQGLAFIIRCAIVFPITVAACILFNSFKRMVKIDRISIKNKEAKG